MNSNRTQVGWVFWLRWVLASIVGFGGGLALFFAFIVVAGEDVAEALPIAATGILIGLTVGAAQLIVLRQNISEAGWWVLACILSFGVAFAVIGIAIESETGFYAVGGMVMGGALVGMAQWVILRRYVSGAGWWVLANTVGLPVGIVIIFVVPWVLGEVVSYAMAETLGGVVGGAVFGAITGGVLVWLLRQLPKEEKDPSQSAE